MAAEFNDGPLVVTRTTVVVGRVSAGRSRGSRTYVLLLSLMMIVAVIRGSTLICRLHCASDRCSPSFANAALSTAPLRNVKLLSSTKVALFSSQVVRIWSFNVFRRCMSVARVVGVTRQTLTLLTYDTTDDVTQYMCNHGVFSSLILLNTH